MSASRRTGARSPARPGTAWTSPACTRQLQRSDFERFDWVLVADEANLRDAARLVTPAQRQRLALYLPWSGGPAGQAIPDPYTGDQDHFEQVWTLVDTAAQRAVARLLRDADSGIIGP
ncbi:MAG: hypothetical protein GAK31_01841 [Stenotrophomonas maltophilia]|uniref:Phosphotyrosine protein phosphatase I domain-containing protein n=1 Tax=Stenotrophomonas maltophilia TaxID=40324 RepID=A0A7V8JMT8_STEMA|nr:MAG: hypothetical protein GAK31_01841 [Stenotrophomonas maltophilia]